MANIQIFEINEDGELLVNDPALAGALQELTPEELKITGGRGGVTNNCNCGCSRRGVV
ncbi:MAG: type A2 lantipeptide [Dolichospermum sp.]